MQLLYEVRQLSEELEETKKQLSSSQNNTSMNQANKGKSTWVIISKEYLNISINHIIKIKKISNEMAFGRPILFDKLEKLVDEVSDDQ